jgi:predicted RNase H-like HicB family nuclease
MEHFVIVIERGENNHAAFSPDVLGCVATGRGVEQTLAEMRSALLAHFEEMRDMGEPLPLPRGLADHLRSGEYVPESGDVLTFLCAEDLFAQLSVGTVSQHA